MVFLRSNDAITKFYSGSQEFAYKKFLEDKVKMSERGFVPVSESWQPGSWGFGSFIFALLLCIILIGILVFIYMIIVKPAGKLVVIYEKKPLTVNGTGASDKFRQERECPHCAEPILSKAKVCKHCGRDVEVFYESDQLNVNLATINLPINDRDDTLLIVAAREGNVELVKRLVGLGAETDIENAWGLTALKVADKAGQRDVVNFLISQKG